MKSLIFLAAVALTAFASASPAAAFGFSPAKTRFTATGPATATLNGVTLSCTGRFRISVNKGGKGRVTAVAFSGGRGCKSVGATGLPWAMTATGASGATIANAAFTSLGGPCGPADLPVGVSGGVVGYSGAFDQCSHVGLSLATTPTLSIVP